VCEAIVERHYATWTWATCRAEPSCGDGRFLLALPERSRAIGVEIDPAPLAERARANHRPAHVICGDFLTADIPGRSRTSIGNPPFDARMIHGFLDRAHGLLEDGGSCGLLLPAYVLQTSSKVMAMNRQWSISQELMPRNIFPRLKLPLVFAMFRKDRARTLVGFFLYREARTCRRCRATCATRCSGPAREGSVWRARRAVIARSSAWAAPRATLDASTRRRAPQREPLLAREGAPGAADLSRVHHRDAREPSAMLEALRRSRDREGL
jgi:adenine-specific DNA-methyltransferase